MYVYTQAQRWLLNSMLDTLLSLGAITFRGHTAATHCVYEFRS